MWCGRRVIEEAQHLCDHLSPSLSGVRFKVVKVANVSLLALYSGKKERPRS